jgi:hypothetical protein
MIAWACTEWPYSWWTTSGSRPVFSQPEPATKKLMVVPSEKALHTSAMFTVARSCSSRKPNPGANCLT